MRAGWVIRQHQALERAGDRLCPCGHRTGGHHELKDVWDADRQDFVRHPDYRPLAFHCDEDGCDCVIQAGA